MGNVDPHSGARAVFERDGLEIASGDGAALRRVMRTNHANKELGHHPHM